MEDSEGSWKELAQFSGTNDGHYGEQSEERRSGNEDEAVALPFLASQLILRAARILYRFLSEPLFRRDPFKTPLKRVAVEILPCSSRGSVRF